MWEMMFDCERLLRIREREEERERERARKRNLYELVEQS